MMNPLVLLAFLEGGGRIETISRTFGVDWPHLVSQIVSFCVVCAVLYRLAYRPILGMLGARREQIALGLANAEKIQAELARTEVQRQEVIQKAVPAGTIHTRTLASGADHGSHGGSIQPTGPQPQIGTSFYRKRAWLDGLQNGRILTAQTKRNVLFSFGLGFITQTKIDLG